MKKLISLVAAGLSLGLASSAWADVHNCAELWGAGFPHPEHQRERFDCQEYRGSGTSDGVVELYYPAEVDPIAQAEHLSAIAEGLGTSVERYRTLGRMPKITAVWSKYPAFRDVDGSTTYAEAFIDRFAGIEGCPVIIYPVAQSWSRDNLKQLIAHELFHCFQKIHYPTQASLANNSGVGLWWVEGTAQFFSNWVYPSVNLEYSNMFDPYQPTQPLTQQSFGYGNVHFFQSYFNQSGHDASSLLAFSSGMPTTAGASQEQALAAVSEVGQKFHRFAEEMVTASLIDSDGREAPLAPVEPASALTITTAEHQEHEHSVIPFTIFPIRLNVPMKGRYRLSIRLPEGARASFKHADESEWRPLPPTLETPCDLDERYDLLITSSRPEMTFQTARLTVDREEKMDCPCDVAARPTHACLFGTWTLDHESVRQFVERTMGPRTTFLGSEGDVRMTFTPDGEVRWNVSGWTIRAILQMGRKQAKWTSVSNGLVRSQYSNQGTGTVCSATQETTLSTMATIEMDGHVITQPNPAPVDGLGRLFTYECSGDQLIYREAIGVGPGGSNMRFDYVLHRAR